VVQNCNIVSNNSSETKSNTFNCSDSIIQRKQRILEEIFDEGTNGGISGSDVSVVSATLSLAKVTGTARNHSLIFPYVL
jgi:hypothetical protein